MGGHPIVSRPFLVIGAMKSGTTTLESLLADHPDVDIAIEKETTAFDGSVRAEDAARRILNSTARAAGEVSTGYMQDPVVTSAPGQAKRLLGAELKVIAVVRDPLDRARSHWRHWEQLGRNEATLPQSLVDPHSMHVHFSRYFAQLDRWATVLRDDQILVMRLEDYARDPGSWQRDITEFLGLSPLGSDEMVVANTADSRLAVHGIAQRISRSTVYRRYIRPLVPTAGRRAGARTLGASVGGGEPTEELDSETIESFHALLAHDTEKLRARWPHACWREH